jgi:hypothetical protein
MKPPVTRKDIKSAFAPFVPLVEEVVEEARAASSYKAVMAANPEVTRIAHLRRLAGQKRWMVLADGMVARVPRYPEGFGLESNDLDHNQGKYAIRFPLGICTIKREPHEEEKGKYLQAQIDGICEQMQLAEDVPQFVGVKAYISVPPDGVVSLISTHEKLPEPIVILFDEMSSGAESSAMQRRSSLTGPAVTSALGDEAAADAASS